MIRSWISAFRLRTLPLSVSGILIGSSMAYAQGQFSTLLFVLGLVTVVLLQILSNLANDLGDTEKGTDDENRIGPKRATQSGAISRSSMKNAIIIFGVLAGAFGLILAYLGTREMAFSVQITFFVLAVSCILAALGYTLGKNAYGYLGLGDLFVFLFFGLLSVCGIQTLMVKTFEWVSLLPAMAVGFLSVAVLNLNNMRDNENDQIHGKNTLVVKIGFQNALFYHYGLILIPLICTVIYALLAQRPEVLIALLSYVLLFKHLIFVVKNPIPSKLDSQLGLVAISTFLYAVLFSLAAIF